MVSRLIIRPVAIRLVSNNEKNHDHRIDNANNPGSIEQKCSVSNHGMTNDRKNTGHDRNFNDTKNSYDKVNNNAKNHNDDHRELVSMRSIIKQGEEDEARQLILAAKIQ
jgi:hypothetical protein